MIYFTSDLHLMHEKDFLLNPRGFNNSLEMSKQIIKNINDIVKEDDTLYILGDLILNNVDVGLSLLREIKCKDIHVILGNHDTDAKVELYKQLPSIKEIVYATIIKYRKKVFYLSHYPTKMCNINNLKDRYIYCLCGHIHTQDKWLDFPSNHSYHIELDAHNLKPISIEDIYLDIQNYFQKQEQ